MNKPELEYKLAEEIVNNLALEKKLKDNLSLIELEKERLEWSLKQFPDATPISSLKKCSEEINEISHDIVNGIRRPEEYADAIMCLFDSAGRQENPISVEEIIQAFADKLEINKNRKWVKNPDNTYSHVK